MRKNDKNKETQVKLNSSQTGRKIFIPKNLTAEPLITSIREPEKQLSTKEVDLDSKKRTFSSPKKAEDWPQKTIRMDRALFDLVGDTANSLGISDKEFCIQALKSEVQKHALEAQKKLLAKIEALQAISKENSTN